MVDIYRAAKHYSLVWYILKIYIDKSIFSIPFITIPGVAPPNDNGCPASCRNSAGLAVRHILADDATVLYKQNRSSVFLRGGQPFCDE